MSEKERIYKKACRMVAADRDLRKAQLAYERMSRLKWDLPEPLASFSWIRKVPTTAPYDAIRGATKALSNLDERVTIHPVSVVQEGEMVKDKAVRERANQWEKVLKWEGERAIRRRGLLRQDIVYSSVLNHEIVAQVVQIDNQKKAKGISGIRFDAAKRFGNWMVRIRDPKTVHVEYSDYMPERVLSVVTKSAGEIAEFWQNKELLKKINGKEECSTEKYVEFDYVDYEVRYAWAVKANSEEEATRIIEGGKVGDMVTLMEPAPWLTVDGKPVPFLPWVCVAGGTTLDCEPEHQRKPLLYPVFQAELWANANITQTLNMSEAIAKFGAPDKVISGPGSENVEVDYDEPGGAVYLTQFQKYDQLQKQNLDPAIRETFDSLENAIRRATVAEVLVTGRPTQGTQAFASFNLEVQQAVASLGDYKNLAEQFFNRMYETMLLIAHYTGTDLHGYGDGVEEFKIAAIDIDPSRIYINTELTVDVPADRVQRVAAASQLVQTMPYSPIRAIEMLGDTDPEGALEEYKMWQLETVDLTAQLERLQRELSGQYEQDVMAAAQQLIQQQMEQMQQQAQQGGMQGGPQGGMPPEMAQGGMPPEGGMPGVGGPMFDPAQGGMPPAMASPAMNTFEQQSGTTRGGSPLSGGM